MNIRESCQDLAYSAISPVTFAGCGALAALALKMSSTTGAIAGAVYGIALDFSENIEMIIDPEKHPVAASVIEVTMPIFFSAGVGYGIARAMGQSIPWTSALALSGATTFIGLGVMGLGIGAYVALNCSSLKNETAQEKPKTA